MLTKFWAKLLFTVVKLVGQECPREQDKIPESGKRDKRAVSRSKGFTLLVNSNASTTQNNIKLYKPLKNTCRFGRIKLDTFI